MKNSQKNINFSVAILNNSARLMKCHYEVYLKRDNDKQGKKEIKYKIFISTKILFREYLYHSFIFLIIIVSHELFCVWHSLVCHHLSAVIISPEIKHDQFCDGKNTPLLYVFIFN